MEVKVGALIIVSLALLAGFVVVMGGMSLEPTFRVFVDFDNPGGLQSGAPVRISGVKVGRVTAIQFRGGKLNPKTSEPEPPIRVVAQLESKYQNAVRENSRWFVTSQGVLGEMFLAVEPGAYDKPPLSDGAIVQGISPPRLDLLLSEGYELLHQAYLGISANKEQLGEVFDSLHVTLKGTSHFFQHNQGKLDNIVTNVEALSGEAREAVSAVRERYVDGPQVTRILNNVERVTGTLNNQLPPLLEDTRALAKEGRQLTGALASQEQLARYRQITVDAQATMATAKVTAQEAQSLVAHVRRGEGTVGALVMDEAIYDDLQEMLRDLKHNPWKFFWRQ
jgi:phospholipid/cholesterol/gamma-HCH transport system substrate-binding protein